MVGCFCFEDTAFYSYIYIYGIQYMGLVVGATIFGKFEKLTMFQGGATIFRAWNKNKV